MGSLAGKYRLMRPGLIVFCLIAGCSDVEQGSTHADIGIAIPSYVHAVAWLSEDRGLFRDQQLTTTVHVMGGSSATMRGLISDSIDVGIAGGDSVLRANRAGADLVIVAGLVNRFYHRLIVGAEIEAADDLRDRAIGLPFLGGPQDFAVRFALQELGLDYEKDVRVLSLGKEFNRIAALSRGDIQATTSQASPPLVEKMGFRVLADLPSWDVRFPYAMVVTRRQTLAQRRDLVRGVLTGLCRGIAFYRDRQNQTESLDIIARHMSTLDETDRDSKYETSGPSLYSWPPVPSEDGFDQVLRMLGGPVDDEITRPYLDLGILKELMHSGACS